MKRKCEFELDGSSAPTTKQLKFIPFPNYESDNDVTMSDASSEFDPVTTTSDAYHTRLSSNASTSSSASSTSTDSIDVNYPTFNLYPLQVIDNEAATLKNIGLLQPNNSFTHHGTHCSQIPKLRIACAAGPNGRRTMWSFCEDCGSISMVDSD